MKLYDNTDLVYNEYIKKNFISKVKIQDKIKELENNQVNFSMLNIECIKKYQGIKVLQELLEEE